MADSKHRQCYKWNHLSLDNVDVLTEHLDITSTIRLATCSEELYKRMGYNKGTRWGLYHWNEPYLLMPQPDYWFDEHYDENKVNRVHDTMYNVVPLDHPRRTAILPFMNDRFWVGMNGGWLAAVDKCGDWVLANIYTHRVINLPSMVTYGIEHVSYPYDYYRCAEKYSLLWSCACVKLLKIIICEVPTEAGHYADYKLIALFDSEIAYLEGGSQVWRRLDHVSYEKRRYHDAIEHGSLIFAVESQGSTYCWDPKKDGRVEPPFAIPPPLLKHRSGAWFLARSVGSKRFMIIIMVHGMGVAHGKQPDVIPYSEYGLNLCQYPAAGVYVFEQDLSSLGPRGVFVWSQVNSLGDNSLFLGLNYPITDNLKIRKCKAPDGILFPFMRKNYVYTSCRWFRGTQVPRIKRCNLQPNEGELVGVVSLPKDCLDSVRQAAIWFKPSLDVVCSLLDP